MKPAVLRAVTFDFWNTLVSQNPNAFEERMARQREVLAEFGLERTDQQLDDAVGQMRRWFNEQWLANSVVTPERGGDRFAEALEVDDPAAAAQFAEVFRRGSDPAGVVPAPGVASVLSELVDRGLKLGIICDAGLSPGATLRTYLEHHGLIDAFDGWSFSDEVGVFKPDSAIFRHALESLGIESSAAVAHVGDLRRTDVEGALQMGWTAVRYAGLNDDAPEVAIGEIEDVRTVVIDHHDQLMAALDL